MRLLLNVLGAILSLTLLFSACVPTQSTNTTANTDRKELNLDELTVLELKSENAVLRKQNLELSKNMDNLKKNHQNEVKTLKDETAQYKQLLISLEQSYKQLQAEKTQVSDISRIEPEKIADEPEELPLDVIFTPENSRAISVEGENKQSQTGELPIGASKPQKTKFTDPYINPPSNPIKTIPIPFSKKQYDEAYKAYLNKNYSQAIQGFLLYIRKFPNADYADNALFWLAMSYWTLKDDNNAEKYFREILSKYAHGTASKGFKSADALFMLGKVNENKSPEKSEFYYGKVTELYSGSVPAKIILRQEK